MAGIADTVIALSHLLKRCDPEHILRPHRWLSDETLERVDKGIALYRAGAARTITMSGAHNFNNRLQESCTHAYAMGFYAASNGVPPQDLRLEDLSLDTVGQAVFTKAVFALPRQWKDIVVVTSDYHVGRVQRIFDFIYGDDCAVRYESVPTDEVTRQERSLSEAKATATFEKQFEGVPRGDTESIVRRLVDPEKGHGYYTGNRLLCSVLLPKK